MLEIITKTFKQESCMRSSSVNQGIYIDSQTWGHYA